MDNKNEHNLWNACHTFALDSGLKKFLLRELLKITSDHIRICIHFVSPTAFAITPVCSRFQRNLY